MGTGMEVPMTGMEGPEETIPQHLEQCPDCSRKFNPKAFIVHQRICKKVFINKREAFDSAAARSVQQRPKQRKGKHKSKPMPVAEPKKKKESKWRKEHEDFVSAMKACR